MNTIEMNYKFLARWYLTPVRTHRYQQDKTSLFWRNCNQRATMTHIWWECPIIKDYWQEVVKNIREITGETMEQNIWTCLFHDHKIPKKQYMRSMVPKLLNAAKGLIPKKMVKK